MEENLCKEKNTEVKKLKSKRMKDSCLSLSCLFIVMKIKDYKSIVIDWS